MPLFPILRYDEIEYFINSRPKSNIAPQSTDGSHEYLSAEQLSDRANLFRLFEQRQAFRTKNWTQLAKNWEHSVFYQVDLEHAAKQYTITVSNFPQPRSALQAAKDQFNEYVPCPTPSGPRPQVLRTCS